METHSWNLAMIHKFEDLLEKIKEKHPNVKLIAFESSDSIKISSIIVPKEERGKGAGTEIIELIKQYAQEVNKPVYLSPSPERGYKQKLKNFYKRLGFVDNKGRNIDYRFSSPTSPTMIWKPKTFREFFESKEKPHFFVDFDETLVSTMPQKTAKENDLESFKFNHKGIDYVSFLRPFAREFINELKQLGNIHILTAGGRNFQLNIHRAFELPIREKDFYAIEDYDRLPQNNNSYLIDNLHSTHSDIINKLNAMGHNQESDRHIKVRPFDPNLNSDDFELKDLLNYLNLHFQS